MATTKKKTQSVTPLKKGKGVAPVAFKAPTNTAPGAKKTVTAKTQSPAKGKGKGVAKSQSPAKGKGKGKGKAPAVSASPKKAVTKKTAAPAAPAAGREFNEHGFVVGSDSAVITDLLLAGGESRAEVNDKIATALDGPTRYGNDKNVSSLVSGLLGRLKERGYTIEQSWRLIAPQTVAKGSAKGKAAPATKRAAQGNVAAKGKGRAKG